MPVRDLLKKPVISSLFRHVSILPFDHDEKSILADDQCVFVPEPGKPAIGFAWWVKVIIFLCVRYTEASFRAELPLP
jgi:hypothetical protein